jgi:RNA polymerase sigma-70 factor, ECF subfamily
VSTIELILARIEDPALRSEVEASVGLDERLVAVVEAGRAAHTDIPCSLEAWADHFARHLTAGDVHELVGMTRAGDVHFALACLEGHSVAHRLLESRMRAVSSQALFNISIDGLAFDDLFREVRTKLLVGSTIAIDDPSKLRRAPHSPVAKSAKLALYSGRGSLDGWLSVCITRTALSMLRPRSADAIAIDESVDLLESHSRDDPHFALLRAQAGPPIEEAIRSALARLAHEDRMLLRLHVLDGLSIDDLAPLYGAHRSTMARRLARVRNGVFEAARAAAMKSLGVSETEFQSLVGNVFSALDLTLRALLEKSNEAPSR